MSATNYGKLNLQVNEVISEVGSSFLGALLPLKLGTDRRHVGSPVCSQTIPNAVLFISASRLKLLWFYPHLSCSGEQICKLMERCNKKKSPGWCHRDDAICRQRSWIFSVIPEVLPDLYVAKTRRNGMKAGVQACVWVYWEKGMLSDITLLYGGCNWTLPDFHSEMYDTQKRIRLGQSEQDGSQWRGQISSEVNRWKSWNIHLAVSFTY